MSNNELVYENVSITISTNYFDNIDLCDCEIKRRKNEIRNYFDNLPIIKRSSGSIVWCVDTNPWCAYTKVTQSLLNETIHYIENGFNSRFDEIKKFVSITLHFYK